MALKALSVFLLSLIPFFFTGSYNFLIDLLNMLIKALGPAAIAVIGLFPPNPCGSLIASCTDTVSNLPIPEASLLLKCLQALAWVIPMAYLANLVGCVMFTVMIYFTMAPVARWFKLIT